MTFKRTFLDVLFFFYGIYDIMEMIFIYDLYNCLRIFDFL